MAYKTIHPSQGSDFPSDPFGDGGERSAPSTGARYRAIFEQSGQGIAIMDRRFELTDANPAFCRMLGYGEGELLGHDYRSLIYPGDLERQPFMLGQALSGRPITLDRLLLHNDGRSVPVEVSVRRISEDEVVMVFWDRTESIAHQNALARERQRLRTLLDAIPGPVWALRRDMSLAASNALYLSMASGRASCFCSHDGKSLSEPCLECPTRLVHSDGRACSRECRLPDGRVFLVNAVPFQGEDGEPLSLGLAVDITTQKNLENELTAARADAETATQAKSSFLATVSHEIRTPLNSVLGHLQLLAETRLTPTQAESVRTALGSGRLLMRLIEDIMDLSRIEAGNVSVIPEDFPLPDIGEVVRSVIGPAATAKGLALSCEAADVTVRSDPARISQIVLNLAGNAVKYTNSGHVRVTLGRELGASESDGRDPGGRESGALEPGGREPGGRQPDGAGKAARLLVLVEDTGPGIPLEKQEMIFRSYTQLHATDRSTFGGVGLGLAIVKRLVEALGGVLSLDSAPGQGTAVRVLLPVEEPGVQPTPAQPEARPLRLLVVEDEKVNQLVVLKALESRGHSAQVASNGLEALDALRDARFNAVLMDVSMPVMDGLEATRAIRDGRAGEAARKVAVVALTAHDLDSERERCLQAGMDACLSKPLELSELDRLLARLAAKTLPHHLA